MSVIPTTPNLSGSSAASSASRGELSQYTGAKSIVNNPPSKTNYLLIIGVLVLGYFYIKKKA